ncbi:transposase InsO family protein [Arthrobacter sp. JUb119]|nr:transposase InsO family protein [Arthrobacter sp. JUb119]
MRRYGHPYPGSLIHVDVTKFGNIPDGGGHRYVGRQQGARNRTATPGLPRGKDHKPRTGTAFVHTVIDDHPRAAYAEICMDERASAAVGVLERAVAWFAERGVTVERVLSDNGSAYRSHLWRDFCARIGIRHKRAPPYQPQTNGTIERFHRTLGGAGGLMPSFTVQTPSDAWLCPAGSTSTTTTDTTQRLAAHPSPD